MNPKVYISGKLVEKSDAKISVFDHGLLYGDGVFEGIRAYSGRVFRLKQHVDRLYESALGIHLQIPMPRDEMAKAIVDTLAYNKLSTPTSASSSREAPAAWASTPQDVRPPGDHHHRQDQSLPRRALRARSQDRHGRRRRGTIPTPSIPASSRSTT